MNSISVYHRNSSLKKLIFGFKHIRFKSSNVSELKNKDITNLRVSKLAEILDCSNFTSSKIIIKNRAILNLTSDDFIRNAVFCSKKFKISDLVEFPFILSINSSVLQHRYLSLSELGCVNISGSCILTFSHILKKSPKVAEKTSAFRIVCDLDHYLEFLGDAENKEDIKLRLHKMYSNGSTMLEIKEKMNAEFLSAKLNCSLYQVHRMFRLHPPLKVQSLQITDLIIDVLFQKLNFQLSKILYFPSLLSLHNEAVEHFLNEVKEILGVDIVHIANHLPLILRRSVDSVKKVSCMLKDFDVTSQQLQSCFKVLTFSPETLQQRLQKLFSSNELGILKTHKKFLWLVYHFNNIAPRLEALKVYDRPYSINVLCTSKETFSRYLCFTDCRSHRREVGSFLARKLDCSEQEILVKLKEYPNSRNASLANCNQVIDFLFDASVSKTQLLNGLGIVLYSIDVVKLYFNNLNTHPQCQPFSEWKSHYNLIQLLIYVIEIDAGFGGSCLHAENMASDDLGSNKMEFSNQSC